MQRMKRKSVTPPAKPAAPVSAEPASAPMMGIARNRMLGPGDAAPWFRAVMLGGRPEGIEFSRLGGSHVVMLFLGSAAQPAAAEALRWARACPDLQSADDRLTFVVTMDRSDAASGRIAREGGLDFCLDYDGSISRQFGAARPGADGMTYHPHWLLLDPKLRVIDRWPLREGRAVVEALRRATADQWQTSAPVLIVPNVLEPAFCQQLIALYEQHGGGISGFMRQVGGQTVAAYDDRHKRRRDYYIEDEAVCGGLRQRLRDRLLPMIARSYQYHVTRIERYVVACYDAEEGGHFAAHRDNTTTATAHRRFAVSINLNDDYDGGDLSFPEFGPQTYRAPAGGAVVFSCSLQHAAGRVTRGRRYATLPFLYDEAAALVREANAATLAGGSTYQAG